MAIISIISKLLFKKQKFEVTISIASLIILIYNPYYIIDTGFILSFGASIGIIYIFPFLNKLKIQNKIINYFTQIILITISVNIFIFPITIYFFKKISITPFIISLIISPITFIIENLGIIIIFIPQALLTIINPIVELLVKVFISLTQINLGWKYFKVLNIVEIITYYTILFYIINYRKKIKKILKRILIILISLILILNIQTKLNNELIIYFIDVGQGDSTLIKTPSNKTILIDGGGNENYDIGKNVLIPYLLNKKINKIDYIIISHFDTDHCLRTSNYNGRTKCKTSNNFKTKRKF